MLMTKKELYTSPEVDVFVIQTEDTILTVSGGGGINGITEDSYGDLDGFILP